MLRTLSALAVGALFASHATAECPFGRLHTFRGGFGDGPVEVVPYSFNYSWLTPHGGFVTYPGLPGSGFASQTDYSQHAWLIPPEANAQRVRERLKILGIPMTPPEPVFLGKNPKAAENIKLPVPRPKEPAPGMEQD
jgi:hypothetical protein